MATPLLRNKPDSEVITSMQKVSKSLSHKFVFGYYNDEDIYQECMLECFKALKNYDASRPLENFLYSHARNRLINLKRDKFKRSDAPCKQCHAGEPCGSEEPGSFCNKYENWITRNNTKANLMKPLDISFVPEESASRDGNYDMEIQEILLLIDKELPMELRSTYLQMRDGVFVAKAKRVEVELEVTDIMRRAGCLPRMDE